mgnify:CR=1 FL=1
MLKYNQSVDRTQPTNIQSSDPQETAVANAFAPILGAGLSAGQRRHGDVVRMKDLSVPVLVGGRFGRCLVFVGARHWGGIRMRTRS